MRVSTCIGLLIVYLPLAHPQSTVDLTGRPATRPASPTYALEMQARGTTFDDQRSVAALVAQLIRVPHHALIPAEILAALKPSLASAEIAYWSHRGPGVDEQDIAQFVNSLAGRLALPEYARTSPLQIRALRMQMSASTPSFMMRSAVDGTAHEELHVGQKINSLLSPLQAVHLLLTLFDQKLVNADYQALATPQEHSVSLLPNTVALRQALKAKESSRVNDKTHELLERSADAISRMTTSDGLEIFQQALALLRIN